MPSSQQTLWMFKTANFSEQVGICFRSSDEGTGGGRVRQIKGHTLMHKVARK